MIEAYFFWVGVAVNLIGAAGVLGLGIWWAMEMWVKFNDLRKPLMTWYCEVYLPREKPRKDFNPG